MISSTIGYTIRYNRVHKKVQVVPNKFHNRVDNKVQ